MEILEVRQQGHGLRVGIVRCRFNEEVGRALLHACHARLLELGVADDDITLVSVPGALVKLKRSWETLYCRPVPKNVTAWRA